MNDIRQYLTVAADALENHPGVGCAEMAKAVRDTLEGPQYKAGTMKAWMESHSGERVDTLQLTNATGKLWYPGAREVDTTTRKTAVLLSGSTRDYKGMHVIHSEPGRLVVADDWHTIIYIPAEV